MHDNFFFFDTALQIWGKKRWTQQKFLFVHFFVSPWKKKQLNWDALKHHLIKNQLSQWTLDCLSKVFYKLLCGYRCVSHHCYRRFLYFFFLTSFSWPAFVFFTEYDCYTASRFLLSSAHLTFQFSSGNEIMMACTSFSLFPTIIPQVLGHSFL